MFTTRPELTGTFGMVASTHWLASSAGMATLEVGGNAFDAAVAAGFVLHVVEPHLNGPGGEVPIVFARGGSGGSRAGPSVLSGQGVAPAAATIEAFEALGLELVPGTGLLAATVPGAVGAWLTLLRDHGTLPLDAVLRFALEYAETGHPLAPRVAATVDLGLRALPHPLADLGRHLARRRRSSSGRRSPVPQPCSRLHLPPTARRSARTLPGGGHRCGARGLVLRIRRRCDRRVLPAPRA